MVHIMIGATITAKRRQRIQRVVDLWYSGDTGINTAADIDRKLKLPVGTAARDLRDAGFSGDLVAGGPRGLADASSSEPVNLDDSPDDGDTGFGDLVPGTGSPSERQFMVGSEGHMTDTSYDGDDPLGALAHAHGIDEPIEVGGCYDFGNPYTLSVVVAVDDGADSGAAAVLLSEVYDERETRYWVTCAAAVDEVDEEEYEAVMAASVPPVGNLWDDGNDLAASRPAPGRATEFVVNGGRFDAMPAITAAEVLARTLGAEGNELEVGGQYDLGYPDSCSWGTVLAVRESPARGVMALLSFTDRSTELDGTEVLEECREWHTADIRLQSDEWLNDEQTALKYGDGKSSWYELPPLWEDGGDEFSRPVEPA